MQSIFYRLPCHREHCTSPCADLDHSSADDISINPLGNEVRPKTSLSRAHRGPFQACSTPRPHINVACYTAVAIRDAERILFLRNIPISLLSVETRQLPRFYLTPLFINPIALNRILVAKFLTRRIYICRFFIFRFNLFVNCSVPRERFRMHERNISSGVEH